MTSNAFHFSPRPNRAGEIHWQPWSEQTFAKAQQADKPLLLAISAVWCHWCHVMDETSYSDDGVIALINEKFIPVRVDNDQRPDINARYNMGGWPTTVILTPEGSIITGATYVPPPQMRRMLAEIDQFYREHKTHIAQRAAELKTPKKSEEPGAPGDLREGMITRIIEQIAENYDETYGGFGTEPKFPHTDALELLLSEYRISGDQRLYEMVATTMLGMSRGGMYDHVEGGFFRYSTTRDWSVPHFEKMAEDHAGLLRALATLLLIAPAHADFRATLKSATGYIVTTLRDPQSGLFGGSQDADEAYFALPMEERKQITAPYIDRTSYSNWTAALAGSLFSVGAALDDERITGYATQALDTLHDRMLDADGLLYHYLVPGGTPQVRGLLTDQAAYLRALLDAHEHTGQTRFLDRAIALVAALQKILGAPDGGFYDHASLQGELGNLSFRDRPMQDNATIADSLLRLHALTEDEHYRETALQTLAIYVKTYGKARTFASGYVRAIRRALSPPSTLNLVASVDDALPFLESAARLHDPLLNRRRIDPADQDTIAECGYQTDRLPVAYLCRGTACGPPIFAATDLHAALEPAAST